METKQISLCECGGDLIEKMQIDHEHDEVYVYDECNDCNRITW